MSFSFKNKNIDPMKIKKFYYYSPEKLKLVPLNNFVSKSIGIISTIVIFTILISAILTKTLIKNPDNEVFTNQNEILEKQFETEIQTLKNKYLKLTETVKNLSIRNNDVRLAVNLEPIEINKNIYGIGGAEFSTANQKKNFKQNDKLSEIYEYVNDLEVNLRIEKSNFEEINDQFKSNLDLFNNLPAIRPVRSSIGDRFGMRMHPILKRKRMHHGLDFLSNIGDSVHSPGDGIVTFIGNKGGYGKVLRINHGFGYETLYAHLSKFKVKKGEKIKRGDLIALSGNSGSLSTGPHLHYEVRHKGVSLNPRNFLYEDLRLFDSSKKYLASK